MLNDLTRYWAVVPAAGNGSRMRSSLPKQYLTVAGKPIICHTLERLQLPMITEIVVVTSPLDTHWEKLVLPCAVSRVAGGRERCHSVLNGLHFLSARADSQDWVLVHDAARPCVRPADIQKLMHALETHPVGGLLALPVRDTMKRANPLREVRETVNRTNLWHALTPQLFRFGLLYEALQNVIAQDDLITDESEAIEKIGYAPVLIEGHPDNIKVTHPDDLELAALYLQQQHLQFSGDNLSV